MTDPASPTQPRRYADSLVEVRRLALDPRCRAVVFDLDGVIRDFVEGDPSMENDEQLGLGTGATYRTLFARDLLDDVTSGRSTFARWTQLATDRFVGQGVARPVAEEVVARWVAYRGNPVPDTVALIEDLTQRGRECFVFTNGTDNVPAELRQIGLDHLVDRVINSAVLGVGKPDPAAYRAAHAHLESRLGPIDPAAVVFTDDREPNVAGAREFGWAAVHLR